VWGDLKGDFMDIYQEVKKKIVASIAPVVKEVLNSREGKDSSELSLEIADRVVEELIR